MMNHLKYCRNTIDQCREFYWKQTQNTRIDYRTIIKSLKRYRDELFTPKSNVLLVKRGDLRWPQSHQVTLKLCFSTITVGSHFSSREESMLKCWVVLCRMISFSSLYLPSKPHIRSSKLLVASITLFFNAVNRMAATDSFIAWSSALISLHKVNCILVKSSAIPSGANKVKAWFGCPSSILLLSTDADLLYPGSSYELAVFFCHPGM